MVNAGVTTNPQQARITTVTNEPQRNATVNTNPQQARITTVTNEPQLNATVTNQETSRSSIHSQNQNVDNAVRTSEEIAAAGILREQQREFRELCVKYGLDVGILGEYSCKRIIRFLEKSVDRRVQSPYTKRCKEYLDTCYLCLDELLHLLENHTLHDIQRSHPTLLNDLVLKLQCHTIGGDWLRGFEDALNAGSAAELERMVSALSVVDGNIAHFEKSRERTVSVLSVIKKRISDLNTQKTRLQENIRKVSANVKRKYPFDH
ncbi:hypothetical protein TSUD_40290 [Trifolium subterraneum]|uniref:Uncharacterized protein n=1 Tax=Trifolium subterraneum TaxID=3900 RepID=A0A2Z6LVN7_TRISU|nr:hypothetical protein TSUD_40290 [Trifolium subterraneum]